MCEFLYGQVENSKIKGIDYKTTVIGGNLYITVWR